jgi:hypothetical protein
LRWKLKHQFLPFLLTLCLVGTASALQTGTSLRVIVVDQNLAQIPGAAVRLKDSSGVIIKEIKSTDAQPIIFARLVQGRYVLEVEAGNFKPYAEEINVNNGASEVTVKLEVADIKEKVDIKLDELDKALDPREGAFTNFLSRQQIAALPDDPEEMEKALRQIAGEDAVIRVDGFTGGRLPPKSQIASIKIIRSNFDAEFHEAGSPLVDISTRAGGSNWTGSFAFRFNDAALNARQPLAISRRPSQLRNFDGFLNGPVVKKKTSLTLFAFGNNSFDTENIVAILPGGRLNEGVRRTSDFLYTSARLIHNLSQTHSLNFTYNRNKIDARNLGAGGFNLSDRAYNAKTLTNQIRISESGNIGEKLLNEFRLQLTDESSKSIPRSHAPTIIVLDAFSRGGAGVDNSNRRQSIYLADNLLFGLGSHALKIGGLVEYDAVKLETNDNQNGTFTFSSLADFLLDKPTTFTQRQASRRVNFSQAQVGVFLQDDLRLHKTFSLALGLRYEWQNNLKDKDNFSPRVSFIWSPGKRGRIVIRGGIGVFYDWLSPHDYGAILSQDASQPSETIIINPSFPNPFASGASDPLPKSFWAPASDLKNPYVISSSIGVETRLRPNLTLQALYRFTRGVHQFRSRDANAPLPDSGRPDPSLGRIAQVESSAFFARNSLDINASGSFTSRISYAISYTLAKTISDAEGIFSLPSDSYNLRLDRSVSNTDQRHRLYGFLNWKVRKGLNLSTIFKVGSPLPYTITTGRDDNGDTIFNDRPFDIKRNSLRGSWQRQIDLNVSWTLFFGNKESSASGPRTIILTESEASSGGFDIDPKKKFVLKFYASATNVLNQTNLRNFVGVQTSPLFGQAVSADFPRRLEMGVRFSF